MSKFAPVGPIQLLEGLKTDDALGDYHLLLAHHVLEEQTRFEALFADVTGATIIMDNSLVELGTAENEVNVKAAADAIQAANAGNTVIPVIADVMGDGIATRAAAETSYANWIGMGWTGPLMVVAQGGFADGGVFRDFCRTVDKFLLDPTYAQITHVGVPRILAMYLTTRQLCVQYIQAMRPDINVHLLGFSDNVYDDMITCNTGTIAGIDSAVPLRYTFDLDPLADPVFTPTKEIPARPATWFDDAVYTQEVLANVENMRTWVA